MNRTTLSLSCAAVLAAASAAAHAEPTKLGLGALDRVTAGTDSTPSGNPAPNGGAIVGNGSTANLVSSGEVMIGDGAQGEGRALNLVNSSESTVANGVNVFDGSVDGSAALEGAAFEITQANSVTQDQRRLSSLPSYERGANIERSSSTSGTSDSAATSNLYDEVTDLERTTVVDTRRTDGGVTSDGSPTFSLSGDVGDAVGLDVEFNYPGGGGGDTLGGVFNGGLDYDIAAGDAVVDTEEVDITITLPSISLDVDAMGCFVLNGSCSIDGERTESTDEINDQSTLYTLDESSSASETWDNASMEKVDAEFALHDAQAEYIVVDESEIDVSASYVVSLSGGAQSGLRAMNVVNAAGSAVANGVNVSRQSSSELQVAGAPSYNLSQINEINHSR